MISGVIHRFLSVVLEEKRVFQRKTIKKAWGYIETTIGHMKSDGLLKKSYLKGMKVNKVNAILCGVAHNIGLILKKIVAFFGRQYYVLSVKI